MLRRLRSKLTYANVMATIAAFMVLTGIGFAVAALPKKSVGPKQLKNGAVRSKKIKKDAVNAAKIKKGAVGRSEIANAAVGTGKISNKAVETKKIGDGAVTRAKVADSAIPFLGTLRSGQILRGVFEVGGESVTGGDTFVGFQSFQFPLENPLPISNTTVLDLVADPTATTVNCQGLGGGNNQTPQAAQGQLCLYITSKGDLDTLTVEPSALTRLGFGLQATADSAGDTRAIGQWALTAP